MKSLCAARDASDVGEVIVSDSTVQLLGDDAGVTPCAKSPKLYRLTEVHDLPGSWTSPHSRPSVDADVSRALRAYLPQQLRDRVGTGSLEEGEHRPVAIVFIRYSDIVDTDFGTLFETMDACIESYGGTLVRDDFTEGGPRLLVLFGAPVGTEDAAFQAVRCAVDLNEVTSTHDPAIGFRTAISYGQVFAGKVGSETRKEYTVIGEPSTWLHAWLNGRNHSKFSLTTLSTRASTEGWIQKPRSPSWPKGLRRRSRLSGFCTQDHRQNQEPVSTGSLVVRPKSGGCVRC